MEDYAGFVVFQPIINGIGGNLVSVQCSRISTMLHKTSLPGIIPPHTRQFVPPWTALFKGGMNTAHSPFMLIITKNFSDIRKDLEDFTLDVHSRTDGLRVCGRFDLQ